MKFIHISDLHFGAFNDIENKFIRENFKRIEEYALENNIMNIIISGDIFDNTSINLNYRQLFTNDDLHFFIIPGNHDTPDVLSSLFADKNNITYFDKKPFSSIRIENTSIFGIPYNSAIKPFKLFSLIADSIKSNGSGNNIILLHGSPIGENFEMMDLDKDKIRHFPFRYEDLLPLIDRGKKIYIAMGHYHKSFKVWNFDNVTCCMPGSVYPLTIKEKDRRAFSIYDTNTHGVTKCVIENITNLYYRQFFLTPFETDKISDTIFNSIKDLPSLTKSAIEINGYSDNIDKINAIIKKINDYWRATHTIPIHWINSVSHIDSLNPELNDILRKIDGIGAKNAYDEAIIMAAKNLILKSYKT